MSYRSMPNFRHIRGVAGVLVFVCLYLFCCTPPQHQDETVQEVMPNETPTSTEPVRESTSENSSETLEPQGSEEFTPEPESRKEFTTPEIQEPTSVDNDSPEQLIDSGQEVTPELRPELSNETTSDSKESCPPGYRRYSIPRSYSMGKKLNVYRCVPEALGTGCTTVHQGASTSIRFVFVGCGFNPQTERKRYNYLVQRIVEGYQQTEPYKSMKQHFTIVRNDNLTMGFDLTHKVSYCYEAWIQAKGEGAQAKPNWGAKSGLWYNPKWRPQLDACKGNHLVVLANNSGWAGGSHANWSGWFSVVGSGNDDHSARRKRQGNEQVCNAWSAKYPGQCKWNAGGCFCDDTLPESLTSLPDNRKTHGKCTQQTPQHCPWPYTHPDLFMEYTALHEVGHTFAGFAHPSKGTQATPVTPGKQPNNCYLPPQGATVNPQAPCPGWDTQAFLRWVLPNDNTGHTPKTLGCNKGCADNLNLYAPWTGTQMMIRDDSLDYGFSPVERKILVDRLKEPCWVLGQKHPSQPHKVCSPGPNYSLRYGTGLVFK